MRVRRGRTRSRGAVAALTVAAVALTACSGGEGPAGAVRVADTVGPGEGELNLVALGGDIENGGSDPSVDWVTPFEERTGCKVSWRTARSPQEMTELMSNPARRYDGVAAPPEVAGRILGGKHVVPLNTNLVDGYKQLLPKLRTLLRRQGKVYGVPFLWGSSALMYDSNKMGPPASWSALYDASQARRHSGRLVVKDTPLTIADVALQLKAADRDLGITDPYSLTTRQLAAVRRALEQQRPMVHTYWETAAESVAAFADGDAVLGAGSPYQVDALGRAGRGVRGTVPEEGVTGWSTAWMMGSRANNPNCMYEWLGWTASGEAQRQAAEWTGSAPANPKSCTGARVQALCDAYRVRDADAVDRVVFARLPTAVCGGGPSKGDRECTDYIEWTRVWIEATKL